MRFIYVVIRLRSDLKMKPKQRKTAAYISAGVVSLTALFFSVQYNYLLFHIIAEFLSIFFTFAIAALLWNTRNIIRSRLYTIIGFSFITVGSIDFIHTLAYYGMNIFIGYDQNLPTQLWIIARTLQVTIVFFAILSQNTNSPLYKVVPVLPVAAVVAVVAAFLRVFPDCYIAGKGLTPFKISMEYFIIAVSIATMILQYRRKNILSRKMHLMIQLFLLVTVLSELSFTLYVDVYGLLNMLGHYLKGIAFFVLYITFFQLGFAEPYNLIFRNLQGTEALLKETHHRIRNNLSSIISILNYQSASVESEELKLALYDASSRVTSAGLIYSNLFTSEDESTIVPRNYFSELFEHTLSIYNITDRLKYSLFIPEETIPPKLLSTLGLMVNEWLTNSIKHAFSGTARGEIKLQLFRSDRVFTMVYADNGSGFTENFSEKSGFGLELVKVLTDQLQGKLSMDNRQGTRYTLRFSQE